MTPSVKKCLFVLLGAVIAGLPRAVPALLPFAPMFDGLAGALGGGALMPRPGDMRAPAVPK